MVATYPTMRRVIVMSDAPEVVLHYAQVLIVDGERWHAYGPGAMRAHGEWGIGEARALATCPILDVSGVTDDERMADIIRRCTAEHAGVINMDGLLTGLQALGAQVL